ncbi:MAG: Urease alpha subunit, partial [uncultured Ramlibacter sp.]
DQSDDALHGEHAGRARRHADGVPPPGSCDSRGPGLRREPHPQGNDRGRGHPARPGRHQHDVQRLAGHGPRRRGDPAHLAGRAQDEGAAGLAGAGRPKRQPSPPTPLPGGEGSERSCCAGEQQERQLPRPPLRRQVHDQPRHRPRHQPRGRQHRAGQVGRPGGLEAGVLRHQARPDPQRRHHRDGRDGRPQRLDPDAAASALPADVRVVRRCDCKRLAHLRLQGSAGRRCPPTLRTGQDPVGGPGHPASSQAPPRAQRLPAGDGDRSADLCGARRRPTADLRAGQGAADGAAVLSLL